MTKIIDIQDTIVVNEPFDFRLILRNDSLREMKFTVDDSVLKSVNFSLFFYCGPNILRDEGENPDFWVSHNYKEHYLKSGDSLVYKLRGVLEENGDSLYLKIDGHDKPRRIENSRCQDMTIHFGGMWHPGDFNPLDAMEGYDFNKNIFVKKDTIEMNN